MPPRVRGWNRPSARPQPHSSCTAQAHAGEAGTSPGARARLAVVVHARIRLALLALRSEAVTQEASHCARWAVRIVAAFAPTHRGVLLRLDERDALPRRARPRRRGRPSQPSRGWTCGLELRSTRLIPGLGRFAGTASWGSCFRSLQHVVVVVARFWRYHRVLIFFSSWNGSSSTSSTGIGTFDAYDSDDAKAPS